MAQSNQEIPSASIVGRNQLCTCGSGKRYKQCCGAIGVEPGPAPKESNVTGDNTFIVLMNRALAAQQAEFMDEAERFYRSALHLNPESFDALHMLGVIRLQLGDAEEAMHFLMSALPLMYVAYPPFFHNLGLCLASVIKQRKLASGVAEDGTGKAHLGFSRRNNLPPLPSELPLVSIVIRFSNDPRYAERTLASVIGQTYPNIEIVVINNGSLEGCTEEIAKILASCPLPYRFVREDGLDGYAQLNAGVAGASGRYVSLLDAGDEYSLERVEYMVRMLAGTGASARWGFSNVRFIDEASSQIVYGQNEYVNARMRAFDSIYFCHSVIDGFQEQNPVLSAGNLFFERELWREVGGFQPNCKAYDWAFCLLAGLRAEPAFLDDPAYSRRIHKMCDRNEVEAMLGEEEYAMLKRWHHQIDSLTTVPYPALIEVRGRYWQRSLARLNRGAHLMSQTELLGYVARLGFRPAPAC